MPDHPLSPGGETLAILDANVLLPPRLSDILFDLFLDGLYFPRWTEAIEAEFIKNYGHVVLAKNKTESKAIRAAAANPAHIAKARRRLNCFRSAVGIKWQIFLYDTPACASVVPKKVNAGDIHVASAALVLRKFSQDEGCADKVFIVSDNLKHLAVKDMDAMGISVVSPGSFINELNRVAPDQVEKALFRTINDLEAPPFSHADLLWLLVSHAAKETANFYSEKWNVRIPRQAPGSGPSS